MTRYAIYLTATGQILRIAVCHPSQIACQVQPGEDTLMVPDWVTDATHRVSDGALVAI